MLTLHNRQVRILMF